MRSRPAVEVRLYPSELFPGSELQVEARFTAASQTPVDELSLTLTGVETGVIPAGKSSHRYQHTHVSLRARFEPHAFAPGVHSYRAVFALPQEVPASHMGTFTQVVYELRVQVDIPWWLDVDRTYLVHVAHPPVAQRRQPFVFRSHHGDAHGDGLFAEATVEQVDLAPGGVLHGAVSLGNTALTRIQGVRLDMVATEHVNTSWGLRRELVKYTAQLCDKKPDDGEALRFRIRLPPEAPCSYSAAITSVDWVVRISAEHLLSSTPLLEIPLRVVPLLGGAQTEAPDVLPAVGRARRALLWQQVAAQLGVQYDADTDTLHGGAGEVAFSLRAEQRKGGGPTLVGRLHWRPLGIGLSLRPASWIEGVTQAGQLLGDPTFDRAFHLSGRAREQLESVLHPAVRAALLQWREAHLDEQGATVTVPGAGVDDNAFRKVLADLRTLATELDAGLKKMPVPAALVPVEPLWRALATRLGGRFEPGPVRITDVVLHGIGVQLGLAWVSATEAHTLAVALFDPPLNAERFEHARRSTDELAREATALFPDALVEVRADRLAVTVPQRLNEPARAEPLLHALVRAVRHALGLTATAPFR